jgi:hypothetical protein
VPKSSEFAFPNLRVQLPPHIHFSVKLGKSNQFQPSIRQSPGEISDSNIAGPIQSIRLGIETEYSESEWAVDRSAHPIINIRIPTKLSSK